MATGSLSASSSTGLSTLFGVLISTLLLSVHQRLITNNRLRAPAATLANRRPTHRANAPPGYHATGTLTSFGRKSRESLKSRAIVGDLGHISNEIAIIADLFKPPTNAKEEGLGTVATLLGFGGISFLTFIGVTFAELMKKPPPLKSSFATEEDEEGGFSGNSKSKRRRSKKNKSGRSKKK
mmetsp:Transcript_9348/g.15194  ORF Transcript_9348/g.15194 Transcript_9348/m.15194 type:complete len:181 (-) Transcript_9348:171-713(-)